MICTISRLTIRRRAHGPDQCQECGKNKSAQAQRCLWGALRLYDNHNDNDDDDNRDANIIATAGGSQVRGVAHATSFGGSQAEAQSARAHHQLMSLLLLYDDDVTHPPTGHSAKVTDSANSLKFQLLMLRRRCRDVTLRLPVTAPTFAGI